MINKNKLQIRLYSLLLLFLPLHTLLIYNILGKYIPYINYWKEFLIILMLSIFIIDKRNENQKVKKINLLISSLLFYLLLIYIADPTIYGLYAIRNYLEPLLVLALGLSLKFSENQKISLIKLSIQLAAIISIWGMFQQIFLGDQFLINFGYSTNENYPNLLHHSHYVAGGLIQRNIGTFSHANIFGLYLAINIVLLFQFNKFFSSKSYIFLLVILSISLLLTFSRSAILALLLVIVLFHIKKLKLVFLFGMIMSFFILSVENNISVTLFNLIDKSVSGTDPSSQGHIDSYIYSLSLLKEYWFTGIGIGLVGPKALQYTGVLIDVESSYFALILDIGFFGFILYFLIVINVIKNKLLLKIFLLFTITWLFLPLIYELEIQMYIFIILAIIKSKGNRLYEKINFYPSI